MDNYEYAPNTQTYNQPWNSYYDKIETVAIEDGITSIDYYAFNSCTSLTSVTIPKSVTSIGKMAFSYCCNLTDIYYPASKAQWNRIRFGSNTWESVPGTVHCTDGDIQITSGVMETPAPTAAPAPSATGQAAGSFNGNYHNNYEIFELAQPLVNCSQIDVNVKIGQYSGNPFRTWLLYAQDEGEKWAKIGSFVLDKAHEDESQSFTIKLAQLTTIVAFEINPDGGASSNRFDAYYSNAVCK